MTSTPGFRNKERRAQSRNTDSKLLQPPQRKFVSTFDHLSAISAETVGVRIFNRLLTVFLILFVLSVPHSIAAAQISLGLGLLAWIGRDVAARRFHFARTSLDFPLLCFAGLTILSSFLSVEPEISLPKLKTLVLFGVVYLQATNLSVRGAKLLTGVLIASSLFGVGFSLMEKLYGRGMVITAIEGSSPLRQSNLLPGDVIWMIARQRVFSPEDAAAIIRRHQHGETLDVEALHAGDPVPVTLTVTDELKLRPNPLGISVNGRSRQFRVSGFSRQFLTYAEQMQILALLAYGGILAAVRRWGKAGAARTGRWLLVSASFFALFATGLVMTASRAVIAACLCALLITSLSAGRRALMIAIIVTLTLGGLGAYVITSVRQQITASFNDDSAARRIGYMQAGLKVIPRHPLLGVGMDSHKRHWREWGFPGDYITHTHSTPIQIAMERGLLALACYLWLIAATLALARRNYRQARTNGETFSESLMLGGFGAVIGFSASSLANYNFGDSEALMLLLCVIGLMAVRSDAT